MKTIYFIATLMICLGVLVFGFASANDIMTVEADIYSQQDVISIEVPDYHYIGNITMGNKEYTTPTSADKIYVNNTGNVNITVTPELVDKSNLIFQNLFMTKRLSGNDYEYKQIGDFDLFVEKGDNEYFYMRLDLRNYTGMISQDLIGYKADVKFVAAAA